MRLGKFQGRSGVKRFRFPALSIFVSAYLWPSIVFAQTFQHSGTELGAMLDIVPLAIAGGALACGVVALLWLKRVGSGSTSSLDSTQHQLATLRARLDGYEALLSGLPELTLVWGEDEGAPRFFGDPRELGNGLKSAADVLDFSGWLGGTDSDRLARLLTDLRVGGKGFSTDLRTAEGASVQVTGKALGDAHVLSLRAGDQREVPRVAQTSALIEDAKASDTISIEAIAAGAELPPSSLTDQNSPLHIDGVIDTFTTPVAIFDSQGDLKQFNRAYCDLWQLDDNWLRQGVNERAIIDRLHTKGRLPAVGDYQAWRKAHLDAYSLSGPREESWHLPDGRSITVIAAPASGEGGVIYVFEDVTEHLRLQSINKSLTNVQRETLNALSEGVAVFGTDGRLRLHNPRLSAIWKLPMNELGLHPHIDEITRQCAQAFEADGQSIWAELKLHIVSLDPNRTDDSGRIKRSDGCLIDYTIVRLPDGQTMLTFVDVSRSANYERVLKERNEALVAADHLKDAFVQNVSYELRSPLTNIIGFADLLASDGFGPLTDQQRSYTDYIRASSAALGILIDNILDLTHVDAGIAKLDLQPLDINELVQKAKAGLGATLAGVDGAEPINLKVNVPDELPLFVADGGRIVQILYNLLSNAANFSEPGAVVSLSIEPRADWFRFIVEDEGVGVPGDMREDMFKRFEGKSVAGRQRGAGLGLTIVKAFVQLHGGTVTMEKREPRGTRVVVNLPAITTLNSAQTESDNV